MNTVYATNKQFCAAKLKYHICTMHSNILKPCCCCCCCCCCRRRLRRRCWWWWWCCWWYRCAILWYKGVLHIRLQLKGPNLVFNN